MFKVGDKVRFKGLKPIQGLPGKKELLEGESTIDVMYYWEKPTYFFIDTPNTPSKGWGFYEDELELVTWY